MRPWKSYRSLCAAGALFLVLPLVSAGCGKSDSEGAGPTAGNTPGASDMAGNAPVGDPGMPGNTPPGGSPAPGAPGMPGEMPPGGPGMPGPGGEGAPAAGGAAAPAEDAILFRQMKFSAPPAEVDRKQPDGQKLRYVQFRYHVAGDPEALLPFVAPPTAKSPDVGSTWLVQLPKEYTQGKKSPGEWENLFCTYVVPDEAAIKSASRSLQSRMTAARRSVYRKRLYVLDVLAGDKLPAAAKDQTEDAIASAATDSYQRTQMYTDLAIESGVKKRKAQTKLFATATLANVGDLAYENGHAADALWLYKNGPSQIK